MWDDFVDFAEFGDFASDASDVAEWSDVGEVAYDWGGDYGDVIDFGDWADASVPASNGTGIWLENLGDNNMSDDFDLYGENVWDGGGEWGDFAPTNDYGFDPYAGDAQSYLYGSPIGPGLNGTPGISPNSTSDSGWFGGIKSALGSVFSGNPNKAAQRQNANVYGRQVMYRQNGNVYGTAPANGLQSFLRSLTGQKSTGSGGMFGGSGDGGTTMMMVAGLAILGVALLAKR